MPYDKASKNSDDKKIVISLKLKKVNFILTDERVIV